jgi:hypothetical protein
VGTLSVRFCYSLVEPDDVIIYIYPKGAFVFVLSRSCDNALSFCFKHAIDRISPVAVSLIQLRLRMEVIIQSNTDIAYAYIHAWIQISSTAMLKSIYTKTNRTNLEIRVVYHKLSIKHQDLSYIYRHVFIHCQHRMDTSSFRTE